LGIMLSLRYELKLNWFCRKMEKHGWYCIERNYKKKS